MLLWSHILVKETFVPIIGLLLAVEPIAKPSAAAPISTVPKT